MREIKFKAWLPKERKMVDVLEIEFGYSADDKTYVHAIETGHYSYVDGNGFDVQKYKPSEADIILMQFTGLLDKNGKEIYEGDIVKNNIKDYSGHISFCDGQFIVEDALGQRYLAKGRLNESDEVIGNIYESPELLKEY